MTYKRDTSYSSITPAAIDTFKQMQRLEARCQCQAWSFDTKPCTACNKWASLSWTLVAEMRLPPWDLPAYQDPEDYPVNSSVYPLNPDAVSRYEALKEAMSPRPWEPKK